MTRSDVGSVTARRWSVAVISAALLSVPAPLSTADRLHGSVTLAPTGATHPVVERADEGRASRSAVHWLVKFERLPEVWQRLAECESSVRMRAVSPSGLHHGLWQIHRGFFTTLGMDAETATYEQQWEAAQYVYERQGARAWTCADKAGLK